MATALKMSQPAPSARLDMQQLATKTNQPAPSGANSSQTGKNGLKQKTVQYEARFSQSKVGATTPRRPLNNKFLKNS
jgi:hypothetical protein